MRWPFILVQSDLQLPFQHRDSLEFVSFVHDRFSRGYAKDQRLVVNVGDEVDQHTLGKYSSDPNGRSASDELEEAKHYLRDWYRAFPKVYLCESNHTYRGFKKGFDAGIPSQFFKSLNEIYEAPSGWRWAEHWVFDGIMFEHGENVSGPTAALNAAHQNRMSTVIGHQHSHAGVIWSDATYSAIFGMNVGCLIDVHKYAFRYGRKIRKKPSLGCGVIIEGQPHFIRMVLDRHNRWIGKL